MFGIEEETTDWIDVLHVHDVNLVQGHWFLIFGYLVQG